MPHPAPPMPPGGWVSIPGRGRAWVWDSGPRPGAPTVVLLHGWTSTAALNWSRCFGPLGRDHRVVAMDHRGHGRGLRSLRPFRLEDCADDVAALIELLDIGPAIVAGYSMGGPVAQLCWQRRPEVVAGLILCATAAIFPRPPISDAALTAIGAGMTLTLAGLGGPLRRAAYRQLVRRRPGFDAMAPWAQEESSYGDPLAFLQAGEAVTRFQSGPWLATIDVPTAVVVTARDRTVPPAEQRWLADHIPLSRTFPVEADHRACIEAPALFLPALLAACRQVSTEARPAGRSGPGARVRS
jgi:3-oxoadipate enol-lactonase